MTIYKLRNRETNEELLEFSEDIVFQTPCASCTSIKGCITAGHRLQDWRPVIPDGNGVSSPNGDAAGGEGSCKGSSSEGGIKSVASSAGKGSGSGKASGTAGGSASAAAVSSSGKVKRSERNSGGVSAAASTAGGKASSGKTSSSSSLASGASEGPHSVRMLLFRGRGAAHFRDETADSIEHDVIPFRKFARYAYAVGVFLIITPSWCSHDAGLGIHPRPRDGTSCSVATYRDETCVTSPFPRLDIFAYPQQSTNSSKPSHKRKSPGSTATPPAKSSKLSSPRSTGSSSSSQVGVSHRTSFNLHMCPCSVNIIILAHIPSGLNAQQCPWMLVTSFSILLFHGGPPHVEFRWLRRGCCRGIPLLRDLDCR